MGLVPPSQRLLFVNVVSIFWNTFLSIKGAGGNKGEGLMEEGVGEKGKGVVQMLEGKVDKLK